MVNSDQFSKRLQKILEYYDLSAASFADAIDVGRSSISHILSGRNKPSLDFVLKIVQTYPEVELYWLLNGKGGVFPLNSKVKTEPHLTPDSSSPQINIVDTKSNPPTTSQPHSISKSLAPPGKGIKKIVIFYEDGTFDAFEN